MSVFSFAHLTEKLNPRRWQIRGKLLFAFLVVLLVPVVGLVVGEVATVRAVRTLREKSIGRDLQSVVNLAERVENVLGSGPEEIIDLGELASVHALAQALSANDPDAIAAATITVQRAFEGFALQGFAPVCYLDTNGQEVLCVEVTGEEAETAEAEVVPRDELQNRSQEDYFQEAIRLPEGEIYVSPTRIREDEEAPGQYRVYLDYATPIYANEEVAGVVFFSVDVQPALDLVAPVDAHEGHYHMLIDENGYFLSHWQPDKLVGHGEGTNVRFQDEYPFLGFVVGSDVSSGYLKHGENVYLYVPLSIDETGTRHWTLVFERSLDEYASEIASVIPLLGGLILVTAVLGLLVALWLANAFTRPLQVLESHVWQFAQGDYSTRVPLSGSDEIGRLAQTFNRMAESIQQHGAELRASEERYRKLFDAAPDPVLLLDAEGTVLDCNAEAEKLFQKSRDELVGQPIFEVAGPPGETGQQLFREKFKELRNLQVAAAQFTHCRLDGSCVELWRKATPLTDDAGNFAGVIIYDRDITAQKEAERELLKFRRAVEQSASVIIITDAEGHIEYVNPKFTDVTGYTAEEVQGKNPSILNSGEMPSEVFEEMWGAVTAGQEWRGELLNRKKDGSLYWASLSLSPIADAEGRITHFLAVQEDITDRKLAEEALRTSEERFRSFFNSAPDAILTLDAEGIVTSCNPAAEELYQRSADAIVGLHVVGTIVSDNAPEEERERIRQNFVQHYAKLQEGQEVGLEFQRTMSDGSEVVIWRKAVPLLDEEGKLRGVLVYDRDITERKQAEEKIRSFATRMAQTSHELAVARKKAEESARLKSEFMATMSHELRTPLNAIIGYGQILLAGIAGEMTPKQHDFVGRILLNGRNLLDLINDILDLSKIEAGRLDLLHQPFNLRAWLDEIVLQTRTLADEKGLALDVVVDDRMPEEIVGDPDRLRQILINLLSNAIKFTDEGRVAVHIQRQSNDTWTLAVSDTGVGIPSHAQEYIFDEFRQVDGSARRKHGGTGLGLAIVRNITLMMGGNVRVQSELGKGSTFTVLLPLVTEVQAEDSQLTEGTLE